MRLLNLPLPMDQRIHLPPGRYLFPWHLPPDETLRFAELLTGLLYGVNQHLLVPWPAVPTLASTATNETLLVVTFEDASVEDAITEALACITCPHAMLQIPQPRESGYAWQERFLKPALITLLQDRCDDPQHPLASFNVAALPVRLAASLTTEALELVELLEATIEHRLEHGAEGTSEEDYQTSLYTEVGRRFGERLLRLQPDQVPDALRVLSVEGAGVWSDERFRAGAKALEDIGLARVAGGSVSLGPMARCANDPRVLLGLRTMFPHVEGSGWSTVEPRA